MSDNPLVNGQITESVASTITLLTGQAPSQAFGMLDTVMVETMAMAMYNAVNRQQNAGMVSSAAVTAACSKILAVPFPVPPPPPPPPPPSVSPLPAPTPTPTPTPASAEAQAATAIAQLQQMAATSSAQTATVNAALADLASEITPPPKSQGVTSSPGVQATTPLAPKT